MAGFELPEYLGKMKGKGQLEEEVNDEPIADEIAPEAEE